MGGLVWVGRISVGRGRMGLSVSGRVCKIMHVWNVLAGRGRIVYGREEVDGMESGWMGFSKVGG